MTLVLKQSTAIDIRMGPFVDATDGVTPETGVSLGSADQAEVLKANGAATVAMGGTFAAVSGCDGWYDYTVAAGDVDTVGEVVFVVQDSSLCLPVFTRATVVEENVYVAWYAASAAAGTDLASILADTNELQSDDIPGKIVTLDAVVDTVKVDTAAILVDTNELQTDDVPGLISTLSGKVDTVDGIVDTILLDTAELQTDDVPGLLSTLSGKVDTVDGIVDAILVDTNELQSDDIPGKIVTLDAVVDTVKVDTAAILVDTNELQSDDVPGLIATLDAVVDTVKAETVLILADTNELQSDDIPGSLSTLSGKVDTVDGIVDAIVIDTADIQSRLPAALSGGNMKADVLAISTSAAAANNLEESAEVILSGTASGTPTTTAMVSNIGVTVNDQYVGRTIIFKDNTSTAALQNQATDITACTASSDTLTFTALTTAPASGDTFVIV